MNDNSVDKCWVFVIPTIGGICFGYCSRYSEQILRASGWQILREIFHESIRKTKTIFCTTASPSSLRFCDLDAGKFLEIFSFPERIDSRNKIFSEQDFRFLDFILCIDFFRSSWFYFFLMFFYPVSFSRDKFLDHIHTHSHRRPHDKKSLLWDLERETSTLRTNESIRKSQSKNIIFHDLLHDQGAACSEDRTSLLLFWIYLHSADQIVKPFVLREESWEILHLFPRDLRGFLHLVLVLS